MKRPGSGCYEDCPYKRTGHYSYTNHTINYPHTSDIKTGTQLIHHISNEEPPQHSTAEYRNIPYKLLIYRLVGQHEVHWSEQRQEKQHYQRIGQGYKEAGNTVT